MKPFNLEAALNGARVVTRCGKEATQLVMFHDIESDDCLCGVVDKELQSWTAQGKYFKEQDHQLDLFMASAKREQWFARYVNDLCQADTETECKTAHPFADGYHKIEWEEADETV